MCGEARGIAVGASLGRRAIRAPSTASRNAVISSRVTPRSIVMRSTPLCCSRRISGPTVSALAIGMSSTTTSSPMMPMTTVGSRPCSSWMAVESASRLRAMIGWPFEYSCPERSAAARRRSSSSASCARGAVTSAFPARGAASARRSSARRTAVRTPRGPLAAASSSTACASGVPIRASAAAAAERRTVLRRGAHHSPR